jgi:hypothetical protein
MSKRMTKAEWKSSNGKWLQKTLFEDFRYDSEYYSYTPNFIYTLKDEDFEGYPSLRRLYLESSDPSEYNFANEHLGGWDHWQTLCGSTWFAPIVDDWRKELSIKLKAEAMAKIRAIANDPLNKNFYTANKYLNEEGWDTETKRLKQGRRSKEIIQSEARKLTKVDADLKSDITQDYKRLFNQ